MPNDPYESDPYHSQPFKLTHPQHLAAIGALFGLPTTPADSCRVLEIGCGAGNNLLPLAEAYPDSRFLGCDRSQAACAAAEAAKEKLGLSNIDFLAIDVRDLPAAAGPFDYIVCHGVFSWVDRDTQEAILDLCASALSPAGVAYISYNTYPGWHIRDMVRNMLLYHARQFDDPQRFLEQGRAMAGFLRRALRGEGSPLRDAVRGVLENASEQPDWYFRHDILEEINESFYFHEFVERAGGRSLQYLGDAHIPLMLDFGFSDEVRQSLGKFGKDPIRIEQYMDFLRNTGFRRTLLCRSDSGLKREAFLTHLLSLSFAGSFPAPETEEGEAPLLISYALDLLNEVWPQNIKFQRLLEGARRRRREKDFGPLSRKEDVTELAVGLWQLIGRGLIELHSQPLPFTVSVGERPHAAGIARLQAGESAEVINRRHEIVALDQQSRILLPMLDGTSDCSALLAKLGRSDTEEERGALAELLATLASFALLTE